MCRTSIPSRCYSKKIGNYFDCLKYFLLIESDYQKCKNPNFNMHTSYKLFNAQTLKNTLTHPFTQ